MAIILANAISIWSCFDTDIDFGINWSIEDCAAVGRGVGLLDWVDTSPCVEVLAPSLSSPLVS